MKHAAAFSAALLVVAIAADAGCTKTQGDQAMQLFESYAGQVCAAHDSWSVCLQKCKDACARPDRVGRTERFREPMKATQKKKPAPKSDAARAEREARQAKRDTLLEKAETWMETALGYLETHPPDQLFGLPSNYGAPPAPPPPTRGEAHHRLRVHAPRTARRGDADGRPTRLRELGSVREEGRRVPRRAGAGAASVRGAGERRPRALHREPSRTQRVHGARALRRPLRGGGAHPAHAHGYRSFPIETDKMPRRDAHTPGKPLPGDVPRRRANASIRHRVPGWGVRFLARREAAGTLELFRDRGAPRRGNLVARRVCRRVVNALLAAVSPVTAAHACT